MIFRMLGEKMVRVNPILAKPVKLDNYSPADYETLENAVTSAVGSPVWEQAVAMVDGW